MKKIIYLLMGCFIFQNSSLVFAQDFEQTLEQNKQVFNGITSINLLEDKINNFSIINNMWYSFNMPANEFLKYISLAFNKPIDEEILSENLGYLNKEDICMILSNILDIKSNNMDIYENIKDFEDISFYAKYGLNYILEQQILNLDKDGYFKPKQQIDYFQGYNIIQRIYDKEYNISDEQFYNGLINTINILKQKNQFDKQVNLVYYNLYDKEYENALYGEDEFSSHACGPTSMAMILSSYTGNTKDPLYMAKWCYDNGFYVKGSGSSHNMIVECAKAFGLDGEPLGRDREKIIEALVNGKMVVALMGKGTFTQGGHYIILRGITDDGKILVSDSKSHDKSITEYDMELILKESKNAGFGGPFWSIGYY